MRFPLYWMVRMLKSVSEGLDPRQGMRWIRFFSFLAVLLGALEWGPESTDTNKYLHDTLSQLELSLVMYLSGKERRGTASMRRNAPLFCRSACKLKINVKNYLSSH